MSESVLLFSVLVLVFGGILGGAYVSSKTSSNALEKEKAWNARLDLLEKRLTDLSARYANLAGEYLRIIGENRWLRQVLRQNGIEVPPVPEDLRPQVDDNGNITINVRKDGVDISGGNVTNAGDLIGGDKE